MKKALFFVALAAHAAVLAFAQGPVAVKPSTVLSELAFFQKQYPRTEGSQGEKRSLEHIKKRLESLGIAYSQQGFHNLEGAYSFSSSIEVNIKGARPDTLLVIVPVDSPPHATKDNSGSINLALALGMIELMHKSTLPVSVRFLFLGGEFGSGPSYPIGTRQFLANFYPDYPVVALYLNFDHIPGRTDITAGGRRIVAPYWLIQRSSAAMDRAGLFYLLRGNENQIFRLGLINNPPLINPYLEAGYPALELSNLGGKLPKAEEAHWVASFLTYINDFLEASRSGFPTHWDHHYLFFQARFFSFILTERDYVLLVILILGLLLAYPIVFPERFLHYLRTIGRNLLSIPLLLALVFVFLLLGTLLIDGISTIRDFPTLWTHAPLLFFVCKIAAALFLFALLYRFLKRLPFSRTGRFYSAASIFLLLVDSIVLGILDFSLAYYFVWALVWAALFSITRLRWLKALFLIISTTWLLKALYDIFTLPALDAVRIILQSRVNGNIIIALIILPFLFMIIRLDFLFRHPNRTRGGITIIRALDSMLGIATAALFAYLTTFTVYGPGKPQPIDVTETMNLNAATRTIDLVSPAPIGKIALTTRDLSQSINTKSRHYTTTVAGTRPILKEQTSASAFLDREHFDLHIEPVGKPTTVSITLSSKKQIVIFDANFPFSYSEQGLRAEIHIGTNPPFPLDIQFTLPQKSDITVTLRLTYAVLPYPIHVSGKDVTVRKSLIAVDSFPLVEKKAQGGSA